MNYRPMSPDEYRRAMLKTLRQMIPILEKQLRENYYPPKQRAKAERRLLLNRQSLTRYERIEDRLAKGETLASWELL